MEKIFDQKIINRALKKIEAGTQILPDKNLPRQAVHTFYGGAHLFRNDTAAKMGQIALDGLQKYAANGEELMKIFHTGNSAGLTKDFSSLQLSEIYGKVYSRIKDKLAKEPIEDYRLDFEDGYGVRSDEEEEKEALRTAEETAAAMRNKTLPRLFGIRVKPLNTVFLPRALRTLEVYITRLHKLTGGKLPADFMVTIPKIEIAEEVEVLNKALHLLEEKLSLPVNSIRTDLMIESAPAVIFDRKINLEKIFDTAGERCIGVNIGIYDYTSMLGISAQSQSYAHPSVDFLRQMMKILTVQKNVYLIDGATHILPVEIYKPSKSNPGISEAEILANTGSIHKAWRLSFNNNLHSLNNGIYQGWDLHPYQLIPRYASLYLYFLSDLENSVARMKNFLSSANNQTLTSHYFDDAASASGLYNYFVKAVSCGALSDEDIKPLNLTRTDFLTKSLRELANK